MQFTLYTADCTGNRKNCLYPHQARISSAEDLAAAAAFDHVCAAYAGNYRSIQNFLSSDVIPLDVDNEASDELNCEIANVYRIRARALSKLTRLRYGAGENIH